MADGDRTGEPTADGSSTADGSGSANIEKSGANAGGQQTSRAKPPRMRSLSSRGMKAGRLSSNGPAEMDESAGGDGVSEEDINFWAAKAGKSLPSSPAIGKPKPRRLRSQSHRGFGGSKNNEESSFWNGAPDLPPTEIFIDTGISQGESERKDGEGQKKGPGQRTRQKSSESFGKKAGRNSSSLHGSLGDTGFWNQTA
mmetsp:Transcript_21208/g.42813  ORF Transcript_21208/g.42813 Transcript_21208/m.42813 type:complete len:198 (-) Transcript_21208:51-644(-)